jgi:TBC1 domain family member 20
MSTKKDQILSYCKIKDIKQIRIACVKEYGLGDKNLRKMIWPALLQIHDTADFMKDWKDYLYKNEYSEIIQRDVNRSLFGLDVTENFTDEVRDSKRLELSNIINAVINKNPNLHYFQGFNSICTVFLLIGGEDLGFKMSYQCAELFIKDSMRKSFEEGVSREMFLIYKLLESTDKDLTKRLQKIYTTDTSIDSPMFSLSWVLTWLSHNIHCFETLCRVFDFCLATHPLAPIYITAAIISTQKKSIMSCEDMPEIHHHFHDVISQLDIELICQMSLGIMTQIHPCGLITANDTSFHPE